MKRLNYLFLALAVGALALSLGAASSLAKNGTHEGHGGMAGHEAMRDVSPEARESIRKAHDALTPLMVQYGAKRAELAAKIYSGADDKTIQDLAKEIESLHSQVLEGRIGLLKQMAKAGLPMGGFHGGMMGGMMDDGMGCPMMGGHGGRMGGHGPMMGGPGHKGRGGCPGMPAGPAGDAGGKAPAAGKK